MVGYGVAVDTGMSEVSREEDGTAKVDYLSQACERWQRVAIVVAVKERIVGIGSGELVYYLGELIVYVHNVGG